MRPRILVIDDDEPCCRLVAVIFGREGYDVSAAVDGRDGIARAHAERPAAVLLDLRLPGMDGMAILERLHAELPFLPVIMLTGSHDAKDAVRAIRLGAFDYLTKPVNPEEIVLVVQQAREAAAMRTELQELRQRADKKMGDDLSARMGPSVVIREVIDQVALVAASDFTVLILGETGTGKELVARALHDLSNRRRRPFVALDCGAIPDTLLESELFGHERGAFTGAERRKEGRFGLAEGGTCFLDEIGNLPTGLQSKLLRVIDTHQLQPIGSNRVTPMDVRFVAATNYELHDRVNQGVFRSDLYFRLAQYTIRLPTLRERPEDIPLLAARFVEEVSNELRRPIEAIVPDAIRLLQSHTWPGNVRELRNVMRQAVLLSDRMAVTVDTIRRIIRSAPPHGRTAAQTGNGGSLREVATRAAAEAERDAILQALEAAGGNKSVAARALKTDYKTLYVKMKTLGIKGRGPSA